MLCSRDPAARGQSALCSAPELRLRAWWCLGFSAWRLGFRVLGLRGASRRCQKRRYPRAQVHFGCRGYFTNGGHGSTLCSSPLSEYAECPWQGRGQAESPAPLALLHAQSARSEDGASAQAEAQICASSGSIGCAGAFPFGHGSRREGTSAALVLEPAANSFSLRSACSTCP